MAGALSRYWGNWMTEWVRSNVPDSVWHRASRLDVGDAIKTRRIPFSCGQSIDIAEGWEEAVDDVIGPDDQHASCRARALREGHWRRRREELGGGELTGQLVKLALEAFPRLEEPKVGIVGPDHPQAQRLWVVVLEATNLQGQLLGAGISVAEAYGDLLANVERASAAPPN
jgi:hypothetical protein